MEEQKVSLNPEHGDSADILEAKPSETEKPTEETASGKKTAIGILLLVVTLLGM